MKWWGYEHVNGSLQVKRLLDREDMLEAMSSPFVKSVYGPWEANSRGEALEKFRLEKQKKQ